MSDKHFEERVKAGLAAHYLVASGTAGHGACSMVKDPERHVRAILEAADRVRAKRTKGKPALDSNRIRCGVCMQQITTHGLCRCTNEHGGT